MAGSIDRRAASGNKGRADTADGHVRRTASSGRAVMDYFSSQNRMRTVARGELLGFIEMLAWNDYESKWYRNLWAWFTRSRPWVPSMRREMYRSYRVRTLDPTVKDVAEQMGVEE